MGEICIGETLEDLSILLYSQVWTHWAGMKLYAYNADGKNVDTLEVKNEVNGQGQNRIFICEIMEEVPEDIRVVEMWLYVYKANTTYFFRRKYPVPKVHIEIWGEQNGVTRKISYINPKSPDVKETIYCARLVRENGKWFLEK